MRWNRFVINICLLVQVVAVFAQDSINVVNQENATYRHRVELRQRRWASLIPNQFKVQTDEVYPKLQSVIDFISNMTDLYAVQLYKDLRGID